MLHARMDHSSNCKIHQNLEPVLSNTVELERCWPRCQMWMWDALYSDSCKCLSVVWSWGSHLTSLSPILHFPEVRHNTYIAGLPWDLNVINYVSMLFKSWIFYVLSILLYWCSNYLAPYCPSFPSTKHPLSTRTRSGELQSTKKKHLSWYTELELTKYFPTEMLAFVCWGQKWTYLVL